MIFYIRIFDSVIFYKNKMFAAYCSFVFLTFPRTLSATRRKLEELLKNKGLDVYHDGRYRIGSGLGYVVEEESKAVTCCKRNPLFYLQGHVNCFVLFLQLFPILHDSNIYYM